MRLLEAKVQGHRIERGVAELQRLRVVEHELHVRHPQPRPLEHRLGDVDPGGDSPARHRRLGDEPRPAGDVQQPRSRGNAGSVEQRRDEQARIGPALLVGAGRSIPARALELPELVGRHAGERTLSRDAGRVDEPTSGAVDRADSSFRHGLHPWCRRSSSPKFPPITDA